MARNMAAMSGTSVSSSRKYSSSVFSVSYTMSTPVTSITTLSTMAVGPEAHTRRPYSSVRLTQMKWNGIVSQSGYAYIANAQTIAKSPHRISGRRSGGAEDIPHIAHRQDQSVTQLAPQPAHHHIHHVAPGVEPVPPALGQQLLPRADHAGSAHQLRQQAELPVGELHGARPDVH